MVPSSSIQFRCHPVRWWTMNYYMLQSGYLFLIICANAEGFCLYGDEPGCHFPCRCSNESECPEGVCPSGCQVEATDFQTPWRGPGCQMGNVALHKTANQNGGLRTADRALDGREEVDFEYCAEPDAGEGNLAEWRVDLGDIYKIHNVTIYNRREERFARRMEYFDIHTSNNTMDTLLCHRHTTPPIPAGRGTTFTCSQPQVGRFVQISRTDGLDSFLLTLCEVIVIGHKYIDCAGIDCSRGACSDVIGCSACHGTYQPNCTIECIDRSFGINCAEKCGNCSGNEICDKVTGKCSGGCQLWWADDTCKTHIDPPRLYNETETLEGGAVSNSSVVLQWVQMYSVPASLAQYYQYTVMYRVNTNSLSSRRTDYIVYTNMFHNPSHRLVEVTVGGLEHNTHYEFLINPQRVMNGTAELASGTVYESIVQKTSCIKPDIRNLCFSPKGYSLLNGLEIALTHQNLSLLDSGCDGFVQASVQYRLMDSTVDYTSELLSVDGTSHIINLDSAGQYVVRIQVENNEEMVGISSEQSVVVEPIATDRVRNRVPAVAAGCSVGGFLLGILTTVLLIKLLAHQRKRTNPPVAEESHVNVQSGILGSPADLSNIGPSGVLETKSKQENAYEELKRASVPIYETISPCNKR